MEERFSFEPAERLVQGNVEWLRLAVEALGALVIAVGVLVALAGLIRYAVSAGRHDRRSFVPPWHRIGKLAAIAVIRTALNFFLSREMRDERDAEAPAEIPRPPARRG